MYDSFWQQDTFTLSPRPSCDWIPHEHWSFLAKRHSSSSRLQFRIDPRSKKKRIVRHWASYITCFYIRFAHPPHPSVHIRQASLKDFSLHPTPGHSFIHTQVISAATPKHRIRKATHGVLNSSRHPIAWKPAIHGHLIRATFWWSHFQPIDSWMTFQREAETWTSMTSVAGVPLCPDTAATVGYGPHGICN